MKAKVPVGFGFALQRAAMLGFVLPAIHTELRLTPSQVSQIQALKQHFIAQAQQFAAQSSAKLHDLDRLLGSGTADESEVKSLMWQIAQVEVDRKFAAYQAGQRMKAVLTPEQRARLDGFTPTQMHTYISSHMTVADHQRMMHFLMTPGGSTIHR